MPIHQQVSIQASPAAVFEVLTTSAKFSKMTGGSKADIGGVGAAFKLFGGDIEGRNIELVPGKRVVQAWRAKAWPEGVYSLVKFELGADGQGTRIVFDQAGYPDGAEASLSSGWRQMYWDPLSQLLAS